MIEAEFALEFLVLLLDGPALMRQADERPQRSRCRQIDEVVLQPAFASGLIFAEQPDLGRETATAPLVSGRHTQGGEASLACGTGAVAPRDPTPRRLWQRCDQRAHG